MHILGPGIACDPPHEAANKNTDLLVVAVFSYDTSHSSSAILSFDIRCRDPLFLGRWGLWSLEGLMAQGLDPPPQPQTLNPKP